MAIKIRLGVEEKSFREKGATSRTSQTRAAEGSRASLIKIPVLFTFFFAATNYPHLLFISLPPPLARLLLLLVFYMAATAAAGVAWKCVEVKKCLFRVFLRHPEEVSGT